MRLLKWDAIMSEQIIETLTAVYYSHETGGFEQITQEFEGDSYANIAYEYFGIYGDTVYEFTDLNGKVVYEQHAAANEAATYWG